MRRDRDDAALTPMILLPFFGALLQILSPRPARIAALATTVASSALGLLILSQGMMGIPDGLVERLPWVGSYAISYEMAVDGVSRIAVLIVDRKSTRLNSSHVSESRMPSSA